MITTQQTKWTSRLYSGLVKPLAIIALFVLIGGTQMAKAQIVANGNFALNNQSAATYLTSPSMLQDWTSANYSGPSYGTTGVAGINVSSNIIATPAPGTDHQYIWLQNWGVTTVGGEAMLSQTITLATTGTYTLTFDVGAGQNSVPGTPTYLVALSGTTIASGSETYSATALAPVSDTFTAAAGTYTLELINNNLGGGDNAIIGFADVAITAPVDVPEPSTALLMGIGAMVLVVTLRWRSKSLV